MVFIRERLGDEAPADHRRGQAGLVFGPHMHNFAEIASAFVAADAGVQVASEGASSTA